MAEFYKAEKVTDFITAIRSLTGEILYLIEGKNKAALIDTCLGVGHLKDFVESLTTKPLMVLLTHGHVDHAMGAPEFTEVYMNHADLSVYEEMSPLEERIGYMRANLGEEMPDFSDDDYVMPSPAHFLNLQNGDRFDLGGIHLTVYGLPGHTKGSMVILIEEEEILILGDACNQATFLFDKNSLPVETYKDNLEKLNKKLKGTYKRVFLSHHDMEASTDLMESVIDVCREVLNHEADDIPFEFMGQTSYIAKAVGEGFKRLDGKEGNIIYNKDKETRV